MPTGMPTSLSGLPPPLLFRATAAFPSLWNNTIGDTGAISMANGLANNEVMSELK